MLLSVRVTPSKKILHSNCRLAVSLFADTGAGHNIIVPPSVAKAYYSGVPGVLLDDHFRDDFSLW